MKVRAIKLGYYGDKRKKKDTVFHLKSASDFSELWMAKVESEAKGEGSKSSKAKPANKEAEKVDLEVI